MEAPPVGNEKFINYNKANANNEIYSICMKIKDQNSIDISITFENDKNTYEECKLYDDIKKEQPYFEEHTIDEAFDAISDLISKDSIEFDNKNEGTIQLNIILPSEERKSLNFILHSKNQSQSFDSSLISKSIKTKDETIKNNDENIKPNDEDIKEDITTDNKLRQAVLAMLNPNIFRKQAVKATVMTMGIQPLMESETFDEKRYARLTKHR